MGSFRGNNWICGLRYALWSIDLQHRTIREFLNTWQTLIAGGIAFAGAYLTVMGIRRQITQADRLADAEREREEAAAKAVLPLALGELNQYAEDCISLLNTHLANRRGSRPAPNDLMAPNIPTAGISVLQTCARYADAPESLIDRRRGDTFPQVECLPRKTQLISMRP